MSSLALRDKDYTSTEAATITAPYSDVILEKVVALFPTDRGMLETLLIQAEEDLALIANYTIDIRNHDLSNADLRGFSFESFDITGCTFEGALLDRISLESLLPAARKGKISLRKVNLQGINLEAALVNRKDLGLVSFVPVNFRGVDLEGAKLSSTNLKRAIFLEANLKDVDFSGSDLSLANAKGANFNQVNFTNATLTGGDFRGCDFRGAIFNGARV